MVSALQSPYLSQFYPLNPIRLSLKRPVKEYKISNKLMGLARIFYWEGLLLADARQRPAFGQISFEILTDWGGHGPVALPWLRNCNK